jgi:hypothetical protein
VIVAGPFVRGQTISLRVGVTVGSVNDVISLPTAKVKPLQSGKTSVPGVEVASVAEFTVTPAAAEAPVPAGWVLTLTAQQTALLPAGTFITDLRCVTAGGVRMSTPVSFRLNESVTWP